jgi:hypothetical protein
MTQTAPAPAALRLAPSAIQTLAEEAYSYFYSLVTMDVTRLQLTNPAQRGQTGRGAANTLVHIRAFPDAGFRSVVAPNFDTLYSSAWLDLADGPALLSVPDSGGRYYLLPMLDMWTDAFAVPGQRTTGTDAARYLIVPPGWQGETPPGTQLIQAPTPVLWMIGRTQTDGPADYASVHAFQDGISLTRPDGSPLSTTSRQSVAPASVDPMVEPLETVNGLSAVEFFGYAARLIAEHPTHATDFSILARIQALGIAAGKDFDVYGWDTEQLAALEAGAADALDGQREVVAKLAQVVNGWGMNIHTMGVYGNYYLKRAAVALVGLGANPAEDAVYPLLLADGNGDHVVGERDYVQHFGADQLPPVHAFWSTTMYDKHSFQAANALNRFALGDRDPLTYNDDGSLDIYYGPTDPGGDRTANWLPAPPGPLRIIMRLYSPRSRVLDGRWAPPPVVPR